MQDSLGDRMKNFEDAFRFYLPPRFPLIVRIDGCHFHSYVNGCKKPFDESLIEVMNETAIELCKNVQNCKMAYLQSDEISLLIVPYQTYDTRAYFDNNFQKIVSVCAATASSTFTENSHKIFGKMKKATFDARAFILPREEVNNYFWWREKDCTRNSIQMVAHSLYSHKELMNLNSSQLQELICKKGIDWDKLPTYQKRGRCIVKKTEIKEAVNPKTKEKTLQERSAWVVDNEIPLFSKDKNYIEQYLISKEEREKDAE